MKKILQVFCFLFTFISILNQSALAQADIVPTNIYAVTPVSFGIQDVNNDKTIELLSFKDYELNDITIKKQDKLTIELTEYIHPKRGKRNGYFKIQLKAINDIPVKEKFTGTMRISEPKDMQEMAEKAGVTIAGAILKVPGFSQGVAVAKGILSPNENETRIKSAGQNLYKSTPLPYIKKGDDFLIEENGVVVLKLREKNQK